MTSESSDHSAIWYYVCGDKQCGPVSEETILSLFMQHTIHLQTLVWTEGMAAWAPLKETQLAASLPRQSFPPPFPGQKPENGESAEKINNLYFHFWLWTVIALPLIPVFLIGIFPAIVAAVFQCILLYKAWKSIPNNSIGVPPILAVLLLFVPVLSCVWVFWALYYMSKEMNRALSQKGKDYKVDEHVVFITCVLSCICDALLSIPILPTMILGVIVLIPNCIYNIFAFRSIKDGIIKLHEKESYTGDSNSSKNWGQSFADKIQ